MQKRLQRISSVVRQCPCIPPITTNKLKPSPCNSCPLRLSSRTGTCPLQQTCPLLWSTPLCRYSTHSNNPPSCLYCHRREGRLGVECIGCHRLQPPSYLGLSYFDLFNDGRRDFVVDTMKLRQKLHELQRRLHPDKFEGVGEEFKKASEWSAFINKGYETLRNPISRAIYLYNELADSEYNEESSGSTLEEDELFEILSIREELEESRSGQKYKEILDRTNTSFDEALRLLAEAFRRNDLHLVRHQIDKLKFIQSIIDAAEVKLQLIKGNEKG